MTTNDPFKVLTTPAPEVSDDTALQVLDERFGLIGDLQPLTSERDQNFHVTAPDDHQYVLKIANSAEDPAVTDFQTEAMLHISRSAPDFAVPRVCRTTDGNMSSHIVAADGRSHVVRLLSWLDGIPLQQAERTPGYAETMGSCLAGLGQALGEFEHAASDYALLWDLKSADALRELLDHVAEPDLRAICRERVDIFAADVRPRLAAVRWQVIHNDLNPSNVLVDPTDSSIVTGVIDFGDIVRSPLIVDVAVAAAYLLRDDDDTLDDVLEFVAAYHAVEGLQTAEIDLLYDLILTRSTMTVLITHWRAALYPHNRDYILRSEPRARQLLQRLRNADRADVVAQLHSACPQH